MKLSKLFKFLKKVVYETYIWEKEVRTLLKAVGVKNMPKKKLIKTGTKAVYYLSIAGYSLDEIESGAFLNDFKGVKTMKGLSKILRIE